MLRLFAAVKIQPTPQFLQVYRRLMQSLSHERIKWVEEENLHITLKFFGETDESRLPAIYAALDKAVEGIRPFRLVIKNTGIFGSRYDPRVIWFGIEPEPLFLRLAENVRDELAREGWQPDLGNFVPHLTIGRIKELRDKGYFQEVLAGYRNAGLQESVVDEVLLFESILRREGPVYKVVKRFGLQ